MLKEDNLELDGVFDGMAIVFHDHRVRCLASKPVDKLDVDFSGAQWSAVRLARETKFLRQTVVRRTKNHECPVCEFLGKSLVGCGVACHATRWADVRGGNAKNVVADGMRCCRNYPEILSQLPA